jgi:hypothetical protein
MSQDLSNVAAQSEHELLQMQHLTEISQEICRVLR